MNERFKLIDLHEGENCPIVEDNTLTALFAFIAEQETSLGIEPYPPGRVLQVLRINDLLSSMEGGPVYEVMFTIVRGAAA